MPDQAPALTPPLDPLCRALPELSPRAQAAGHFLAGHEHDATTSMRALDCRHPVLPFGNHRHVGDARGRGLFMALELVASRAGKAHFDPAHKLNLRVKPATLARGLACYPGGGTVDRVRGDHALLAPPSIPSADEIALIVGRIGAAVDDALAGVPS